MNQYTIYNIHGTFAQANDDAVRLLSTIILLLYAGVFLYRSRVSLHPNAKGGSDGSRLAPTRAVQLTVTAQLQQRNATQRKHSPYHLALLRVDWLHLHQRIDRASSLLHFFLPSCHSLLHGVGWFDEVAFIILFTSWHPYPFVSLR